MLDKDTAKRLMVTRVREWDTAVLGDYWFDDKAFGDVFGDGDLSNDEWLQQNPEAGLDHG